MNKSQKLTNKMAISLVRDLLTQTNTSLSDDFTNEEIIEKLDKIAETFDKKSSRPKESETKKENMAFADDITTFLSDGGKYTATEIWHGVPSLEAVPDMTNQRVSYILRMLKMDGKVDKQMIKGKQVYWAL